MSGWMRRITSAISSSCWTPARLMPMSSTSRLMKRKRSISSRE